MLKKSKKKKNLTEPGLESTTSGLEKPALLSTRLSTIIAITNQRTNGPVNAHLISWPSKAQNIQNLENIW